MRNTYSGMLGRILIDNNKKNSGNICKKCKLAVQGKLLWLEQHIKNVSLEKYYVFVRLNPAFVTVINTD